MQLQTRITDAIATAECGSDKMTATTGLITATFHLAFLLIAANASKEVQQQPYSSVDRLKALKQLVNAEQVGFCTAFRISLSLIVGI